LVYFALIGQMAQFVVVGLLYSDWSDAQSVVGLLCSDWSDAQSFVIGQLCSDWSEDLVYFD